METFKIAVCQQRVRETKEENLEAAADAVREAALSGARIIALPEMFVCEFVPDIMRENAEPADGNIRRRLGGIAAENGVWLVGGSFPEKAGVGKFYNTCPVFSPDGEAAVFYRKTHLFDANISGSVSSAESGLFDRGTRVMNVNAGFVRFGTALCYDVRFPYVFTGMADKGAKLAFLPAAFSAKTGEAHWEILVRARALDSQMYIAAACCAFSKDSRFKTYGHSMIVDPWGTVLAEAGADEEIITADIDLTELERIRRELPVLSRAGRERLIWD